MRALILDTETTGLSHNVTIADAYRPEIVELYMAEVYFHPNAEAPVIGDEIDLLIKPRTPIDEASKAAKVTGITNEMLRNVPSFANVFPRIKAKIEAAPLVIAHNASFDVEMLDIEAARCGDKIAWPRVMCTVEQSSHVIGHRLSLGALHEHLLGLKFEGAHRAKVDVAALIRCVAEMVRRGML